MSATGSILPPREVRTSFFMVETLSGAGSVKCARNTSQIKEMVDQANQYILQPQANVSIVIQGQAMELSFELFVSRESGINTDDKSVRSRFCQHRDGTAHFTVFCVQKLSVPEATFLPEQFCMIEDGTTSITNEVTYGAFCLAHALGHLLNHQEYAPEHSLNKGDLMFPVMEQGGLNISAADASLMNRCAGKLKPSSAFPCV